ncbi:Fibronectin type III [uncultured Caudovirales phage]|uniref:Fibronectin type III n=1 Tax=uncultured Caudovirales phage TaxID=2100421 RepID=A0A6J7WY67_9CAUD|nr:Fibronectin type III [uncultured Caudovirales phage]
MSTTRVGILDENKEYFWKTVNGVRAKVGAGWRNVSIGYVKVNGEWKEVFIRPGPTVRNFILDPITNDSVTFKWYAGPNVVRSELWMASRASGTSTPLSFTKALDINSTYVTPSGQKIILDQGSATITGIGTNFTSLVPENIIYTQIDGQRTLVGTVKSVESNTSLTLKSEWTGLSSANPLVGDTYIYQTNNSYLYNTSRETEYLFYLIPIEQVGAEEVPGDKSNTIQRITPIGAPPPITDLALIAQDGRAGSFTLGWTPSPRYKTDSYIYYNDGGSTTTDVTTAIGPFTSLDGKYDPKPNITGASKTYAIQIQAFNEIGEGSGKSNIVYYTYSPIIAKTLTSPTISGSFLPATNNTSNWNTITVRWTSNPADHDYYELWAKPASSSTYSFVSRIEANTTDAAGTIRTATYTGPTQNTQYDVQLRTYANPPADGYEWKTPPGTQVTSNSIRFRTGQPQLTRTVTGSDIKYINGTRSTTAVTVQTRGTAVIGQSTSFANTGLVGETVSQSAVQYGISTTTRVQSRTKPARATWGSQPWSTESTSTSNTTASSCINSETTTLLVNTSTLQRRRVVTVSCTLLPRTTTTTTHTTEFDFSASAIRLGGGETLTGARLTISASTSGAVNVNVGGTNYSENGSVSITSNNIYNKLIVAANRVRITRSTSPLITYSNAVVRVDYDFSYTTTTQNFGAPALV